MNDRIENLKKSLGFGTFNYQIPSHANRLSYLLGGITSICLGMLFISGIILTQYYNPVLSEANLSVNHIKEDLYLGWFIRGIHYWTVQVIAVTVLLHLIRVFITASYKRPREFIWVSGVALLSLIAGFIFTGTVLKWDQEAYEAIQHYLWAVERLGSTAFFLSEESSYVPLFSRLYTVHISILPIALLLLAVFHLFFIKMHGISQLPSAGEVKMVNFTSHLKKLIKYSVLTLLLISILTLMIEPPLGKGHLDGVEITKPPWMFLWIYSMENLWVYLLIIAPSFIFIALFLLPFMDRNSSIKPQERKGVIMIFVFMLILLIGLIINGLMTSGGHHMD